MNKILILGATSALAHETAKQFARDGAALFLVGRNEQKLQACASELRKLGASKVESLSADLDPIEKHANLIAAAESALGGIDAALIAQGMTPDQKACERDFRLTAASLHTNFVSVISLASELANYFEGRRAGCLAVISSVAGDRGRQSNYVYGTAKAGINAFFQGLRNRLHRSGVRVVTIKPGFVDTPMTANHKKGLLFAKANIVGRGIYKAMRRGKNISYQPGFWCLIMGVIKALPECIFKRLSL